MENTNEKALNTFLSKTKVEKPAKEYTKNTVLDEREGLIERVDKVLITKEGKQLLREQY